MFVFYVSGHSVVKSLFSGVVAAFWFGYLRAERATNCRSQFK